MSFDEWKMLHGGQEQQQQQQYVRGDADINAQLPARLLCPACCDGAS